MAKQFVFCALFFHGCSGYMQSLSFLNHLKQTDKLSGKDHFLFFATAELMWLITSDQRSFHNRGHMMPTTIMSSKMSLDYVEKDAVLFALPNDLAASFGKGYGLGGILKIDGQTTVQLQLLCIREGGSTEFYADSRVPPITVSSSDVVRVRRFRFAHNRTIDSCIRPLEYVLKRRGSCTTSLSQVFNDASQVLDTYPSQRPIPSLGGGIGYGAEAVDCWELQASDAMTKR